VVHLDTNYRSFSEVIDFNNRFFAYISNLFQQPDYKKLYAKDSFQKENTKKSGCVSFRFVDKNQTIGDETINDLHLKATLESIKTATDNGFSYKDIVILTRKKSQGISVSNDQTENNILNLSSETLLINNSSNVQIKNSLSTSIIQNNDNESKPKLLYLV